jgi:hypothetical protein
MIGGCFMHGKFNNDGRANGEHLASIYPDMETALLGKFEDFVMKSARETEVKEAKCDQGLML